jgi:hypothetical protein
LSAQGVGYLTRTAISAATITLHIKHDEKDGVELIDIDTTLTGGIRASPEYRRLDYEMQGPLENKIYGQVCKYLLSLFLSWVEEERKKRAKVTLWESQGLTVKPCTHSEPLLQTKKMELVHWSLYSSIIVNVYLVL